MENGNLKIAPFFSPTMMSLPMPPTLTAEYPDLKPWRLPEGILYGPFPTRRKGRALGINLLPPGDKACTFNCVYCQCGWTPVEVFRSGAWKAKCPSLEDVRKNLEEGFAGL